VVRTNDGQPTKTLQPNWDGSWRLRRFSFVNWAWAAALERGRTTKGGRGHDFWRRAFAHRILGRHSAGERIASHKVYAPPRQTSGVANSAARMTRHVFAHRHSDSSYPPTPAVHGRADWGHHPPNSPSSARPPVANCYLSKTGTTVRLYVTSNTNSAARFSAWI
jgi:hypothetical protein